MVMAASCRDRLEPVAVSSSLKIAGISPDIVSGSTKAVDPLQDSVGRTSFAAGDDIIFTNIQRTSNPITQFTYSGIQYTYSDLHSWGKITSGDIYWSDAVSPHTFIGYSIPNPKVTGFDWTLTDNHYYGTIGAVNGEGLLVYDLDSYSEPEPPVQAQSDDEDEHTSMKKEDVLLMYHNNLLHSDNVAYLEMHHGLASVRVTTQISGFSTSNQDNDHTAKVHDLVIKNQPVKYRWAQNSYACTALDAANQVYRDMKLCIPRPNGYHEDSMDNTFVFYGITTPHTDSNLEIEFTVHYTNPMPVERDGSDEFLEKTYKCSISNVLFDAGYCTSIIIRLNHRNEEITVGASYNDWIYVDTPDEGELSKIQVFLKDADPDRQRITIHGDQGATRYDATWLFEDTDGTIRDIFGHDGSEGNPYMIRTADQFLSFAYEVNVGKGPSASGTFGTGWDFANKHINLDSGLILQPSNTGSTVNWPGIGIKTTPGVDSDTDRPFNGHLHGGVRLVKRLKGKPLFGYIGPTGHVDQLLLEDVLDIDGAAAYATQNDGIICAGKVASVVGESFALKNPISVSGLKLDETDNFTEITWNKDSDPYYENGATTIAAPLVAYNNGIVLACYCVATVSTSARRSSGIIGYNNGAMVVDYSAVKVNGSAFYRGTVAYNRYHPNFFIGNHKPHPDKIAYQTVNFDKKAERIFDWDDASKREVTYTVVSLKNGQTPLRYEWGEPRGTTVEIVSAERTTASLTVRSKHGERGETFFPVKVYYSNTEYVEDYVRAMAADPLLEPTRLKGDYAGKLTYCFFDYEVSGVDPTLALGQVYGYTTAQMQSRHFIGSPDYSNVDTNTLNGTIHTFASESNAHLIPASIMEGYKARYYPIGGEPMVSAALKQLSAHCMSRYYVFHAASYPWVY